MAKPLTVEVVDGSDGDRIVGELMIAPTNTFETYSFTYADDFISNGYFLGDDIPLRKGRYHLPNLPRVLDDTSPDRWGKMLMRKAHPESRDVPSTYLLGVSDTFRQGALRLRKDGVFLSSTATVPRIANLPHLANAARVVAKYSDEERFRAVKELVDMGSSALGGAHPKVAASDDRGNTFLVKVGVSADDVAALRNEHAALQAAANAGIRSEGSPYLSLGGSALVIPRFDRNNGVRTPYMSAMTLVNGKDNSPSDVLEVLGSMERIGTCEKDSQEVWRRIAFGAIIVNTDDHLRNHGFIRVDGRWTLSPVFDVNPSTDTNTHQMGVGGKFSNDDHAEALPYLAEMCRVDQRSAHEFVERAYDSALSVNFTSDVKSRIRSAASVVMRHVHAPSFTPEPLSGSAGDVHVSEYVTAKGTVVREHTRKRPNR